MLNFARRQLVAGTAALIAFGLGIAHAADPIKLGGSLSLTGPLAASGKQVRLVYQLWAERMNAKGGLLGRNVELTLYDDQGNPANVPGIYTKLLDVDKIDIALTSSTNMSGPAMPIIIERNKFVAVNLALGVNNQFNYENYIQSFPYGSNGKLSLTQEFFQVAGTLTPKAQSIAYVYSDSEYGVSATEGARIHAGKFGLKSVYDRSYPPNQVDFLATLRAVQAANPDIIFIACYPGETVNIVKGLVEVGMKARMIGGGMAGLQFDAVRKALGDKLNGLANFEVYLREPSLDFPGMAQFLADYRPRAEKEGVDALGFYAQPVTYSMLQVVEEAIEGTKSLDPEKLSKYIKGGTIFKTIMGDLTFGKDGEWAQPRIFGTQFQNVVGNDIAQYDKPGVEVILGPDKYKTGTLREPVSFGK